MKSKRASFHVLVGVATALLGHYVAYLRYVPVPGAGLYEQNAAAVAELQREMQAIRCTSIVFSG